MGSYTVITETGEAVASLLRRFMVPEVVQKEEQIGLCSPREPGEYRVGIYLYDIQESAGVRNAPRQWKGETVRFPSAYLDLYYMLVPFSKSDLRYRAAEEHRLLGKMLQILRDYPNLNANTYEQEEKRGPNTIQLELLDMDCEDKLRIWNSLNEASHTALYCKVSPVELESEREEKIRRVREIQMQFGERDWKQEGNAEEGHIGCAEVQK